MVVTRKFLLLSPWTLELLAVSVEEARRLLIRPPGSEAELLAELLAAESEASRGGQDQPVGSPDGEAWLVSSWAPWRVN